MRVHTKSKFVSNSKKSTIISHFAEFMNNHQLYFLENNKKAHGVANRDYVVSLISWPATGGSSVPPWGPWGHFYIYWEFRYIKQVIRNSNVRLFLVASSWYVFL